MQKKKNNLISRRNPVKRNMDKLHKPRTHRDKTKYDRKRVPPPRPENVFQPFNGGKGG